MTMKSFYRFLLFVILLLVQVEILSRLHIHGFGTPALYIYYLLITRSDISRNNLIIQGFLVGICVDIFAVTPGLNAGAATIMSFFRPLLLRVHSMRDPSESYDPSIRSMGFSAFLRYALISVLLFEVVLCLLDSFTFFRPVDLIVHIVADTLTTTCCIMCVDAMRGRR